MGWVIFTPGGKNELVCHSRCITARILLLDHTRALRKDFKHLRCIFHDDRQENDTERETSSAKYTPCVDKLNENQIYLCTLRQHLHGII